MSASHPPRPTRPVRFFHRGVLQQIDGAAPTRTLLDWLREDARPRCTGTKEGCNEGDCGACTVLVAERDDAAPGGVAIRNVNACLSFLPTLDGRAVLTVEDLKPIAAAHGQPAHPVQQALVACHGSQCGFCTPGFAMTMTGIYEDHAAAGTRPTRQQLADDLAGNLCRCTGYRPIVDAGERMFDTPATPIDRAALRQQLDTLAADAPLHCGPAGAAFHAPQTLDDFAALRLEHPDARLLAGATDIALWVNKQFRDLGELIWIGRVAELRRIETTADAVHIGAAASLEDAWGALADVVPTLREVWQRFASPPIRHAGTMGGNIANGSPIGDSAPVLIALGADIVLRRGAVERTMPLQDFYLDYMKNALQPGEFVARLVVPKPPEGTQVRVWKISKRYDSDISAVCAAFALRLDGDRVAEVRLAFGGMAAIVKRATQTEAALLGQPWTDATLVAAQAALAQDFRPLSDLRASAAYRLKVSANLLRRLWLETRPDDPLPPEDTTVWAPRLTLNIRPEARP
ncbi:xanthine dehydrogenase small subunit [Sphaerotilus sp.]|uniref:xanthine dehydrogenase small subunit n=1 Tax=Sphaerotilus sp. TaxID=2093942 RepID=UPI002ACEE5E7|nr:xanthine dehydrogenase small subunit [Sphaerotilus sp.]MDZ7857583.1 xanthine dehydrogenase small subunit [Sphaerotilus sp.]